jgi:uncharacterized protein
MDKPIQLTKGQARRFLLSYQGLWPTGEYQGKPGILDYIRHVGCIQFDPLNIVGHNHELVLQSRVAGFRPALTRELLYEERRLLDGFDKMMSIYCVEDWPYFRRWREAVRNGNGRSSAAIRSVLPQVRAALEERGPLSSLDLELGELVDWDWSQSRLARAALESMYFWGELVIHHKVHTRKVYDFAQRCLPGDLLNAPDPNETDEQFQDWYVLRRIGSIGMLWGRSGEAWLALHTIQSPARKAALKRMLSQRRLVQVQVEGIADPFYLRSQDLPVLERTLAMDDPLPQASVIAPLDNLLWDRRMLNDLFHLDYRWEVYVPAPKRRYGYYVLPVLYGDRFIARFEPDRDQRRGVFIIKNWWWEDGVTASAQLQSDLLDCFRRFLGYLDLPRLEIDLSLQERASLAWLANLSV